MEKLIMSIFLMTFCMFITTPCVYTTKQIPDNDAKISWFQTFRRGNTNIAKLHFYLQSIPRGPNATVYTAANASITSNSSTKFGEVHVLDDLLTVEPHIGAELVGRMQGLVAYTDMRVRAIAMNVNYFFTSGKFNGSSFCIVGRNPLGDEQRELPVVGGTGLFRFARGYAITSTILNNPTVNHIVVDYTVYVTYNSSFYL